MSVTATEPAIAAYIDSQPEAKRRDLAALHARLMALMPGCRLWFLDGRDESGRVVTNPNIGYGVMQRRYADGRTREFYQIGLSANTSGISVYIMGLADKTLLAERFGGRIGKATVTGYCIKFRKVEQIDLAVLDEAVRAGIAGGV